MNRVWVGTRSGRGKRRFQLIYRDDSGAERRRLLDPGVSKRDAERAAVEWEIEIRNEQQKPVAGSWVDFRNRFFEEYLDSRSNATAAVYQTTIDTYAKLMRPAKASDITSSTVSRFASRLRQNGLATQTIVTYLKHLRAAVRWAHRMGMVPKIPLFEMPRTHVKTNKGRALSEYEVKRMLVACKKVDPDNYLRWQRLIWGMYLSGLRLSEALKLSWDCPPVMLDFDGQYPQIHFSAIGHKSRRDESVPITPEFADYLKTLPKRTGLVFGCDWTTPYVGRIISDAGRLSGVRSGSTHATAHDLRRSFATRWAQKVKPVTLKALMRHSDIKTTLAYYVGLTSDDIAGELWRSPGSAFGSAIDVSDANLQSNRLRIAR